jgi:hypothetical protein
MLAIVTMWALVVGVAVGVPQSVLAPVKELARTEARQRAHLSPKLLGLDLGRRLAAGPRGEAWPALFRVHWVVPYLEVVSS